MWHRRLWWHVLPNLLYGTATAGGETGAAAAKTKSWGEGKIIPPGSLFALVLVAGEIVRVQGAGKRGEGRAGSRPHGRLGEGEKEAAAGTKVSPG